MLYNVAIHSTRQQVKPVPLLVEMSEGQEPRVLTPEKKDAADAGDNYLAFGIISAGLVGEMVYEAVDADTTVSAKGGLYGVPLWLSESSLKGVRSHQGMKKLWLLSDDMTFGRFVVAADKAFPRVKFASKVPAAIYGKEVGGSLLLRVQDELLALKDEDEVAAELSDEEEGIAQSWCTLGVTYQGFAHEHGNGVTISFADRSQIDVTAHGSAVQHLDMDYPIDGHVVAAESLGRN